MKSLKDLCLDYVIENNMNTVDLIEDLKDEIALIKHQKNTEAVCREIKRTVGTFYHMWSYHKILQDGLRYRRHKGYGAPMWLLHER